MPELKQRKQKEGKATGSRNDDSVSRRCRRRILLGQAPCALSKCFASTETRRHDVGQATSAQSSPSRSAALALVQNNGSLVLGQEIPGAGRRRALFTDARRRSARKCSRLGVVSQADRGALDPAALKVPLGLRRPRGLPGATDKTCLGRESSRALGHRHVSRTTAATWSGNCSFHAKPDQASAQHDPRGEVVETLHEPGGAGLRLGANETRSQRVSVRVNLSRTFGGAEPAGLGTEEEGSAGAGAATLWGSGGSELEDYEVAPGCLLANLRSKGVTAADTGKRTLLPDSAAHKTEKAPATRSRIRGCAVEGSDSCDIAKESEILAKPSSFHGEGAEKDAERHKSLSDRRRSAVRPHEARESTETAWLWGPEKPGLESVANTPQRVWSHASRQFTVHEASGARGTFKEGAGQPAAGNDALRVLGLQAPGILRSNCAGDISNDCCAAARPLMLQLQHPMLDAATNFLHRVTFKEREILAIDKPPLGEGHFSHDDNAARKLSSQQTKKAAHATLWAADEESSRKQAFGTAAIDETVELVSGRLKGSGTCARASLLSERRQKQRAWGIDEAQVSIAQNGRWAGVNIEVSSMRERRGAPLRLQENLLLRSGAAVDLAKFNPHKAEMLRRRKRSGKLPIRGGSSRERKYDATNSRPILLRLRRATLSAGLLACKSRVPTHVAACRGPSILPLCNGKDTPTDQGFLSMMHPDGATGMSDRTWLPSLPAVKDPWSLHSAFLRHAKDTESDHFEDLRENGSAMLASPGRLLTWKPAVGPAFCLFEAKLHHQRVRQRTRIHAGNGKDTPAVQGIATMMRALPSVMPQLKQRKQKERKATGSTKGDSVSRRCHRQILLGQGPCALAKCFVSTETRRHDVGRLAALALKGPLHGLRQPAALKVFFGRGAILVQPTRRYLHARAGTATEDPVAARSDKVCGSCTALGAAVRKRSAEHIEAPLLPDSAAHKTEKAAATCFKQLQVLLNPAPRSSMVLAALLSSSTRCSTHRRRRSRIRGRAVEGSDSCDIAKESEILAKPSSFHGEGAEKDAERHKQFLGSPKHRNTLVLKPCTGVLTAAQSSAG
ncbi:hypothetical protein AK812_SmicGene43121 [Symbiodinium microadriaticum]|uniref:Uncharacterized protein n=1 Tax=Symbiodinium microadriaticum TaxID=2951 RepID=A0A1Q9C1U7_SYMMI|nr:hypothetical protein AK812_SmicGene43121 [Symbiodinium microadriaticum]